MPNTYAIGNTVVSEQLEIDRVSALMLQPNSVFVFGSNRLGIHGAGAAATAVRKYGAIYGRGMGLQRRSLAVPTKDAKDGCVGPTLSLESIDDYVMQLRIVAAWTPDTDYAVTRLGCGLANLRDEDVALMFQDAPRNLHLPIGWRTFNGEAED